MPRFRSPLDGASAGASPTATPSSVVTASANVRPAASARVAVPQAHRSPGVFR
jgi:hypothetical protein